MAPRIPDPLGLGRLTSSALEALASLSTLPSQLDRLLGLVEETNRQVRRASDGIDDMNRRLDSTLPELAQAAGALHDLVENLRGAVGVLADQLPGTTDVLRESLPRLTGAIDAMEVRIGHLDGVVNDLGQTVVSVAGAIPGVRRAVRGARPSE